MPICKKCNAKFPNRIKIGNKIKVLGNRKFCLECSPYNMHNTRDLNKKSTIICDEKSCPKSLLILLISGIRNSLINVCLACFNLSIKT